MSRLKEWLLVAFCSPEMVAIVVLTGIALFWPMLPEQLGRLFQSIDAKIQVVILGLPFAFTALTYKLSRTILNPGEYRKDLVEWPGYWRLKTVIRVALGFCAVSCFALVVGWLLVLQHHLVVGATMIVVSITVSSFTLASVALAKLDEQDILDGASGT